MRRLIVCGLLASAVVVGSIGPSGAVPKKGDTFTANCGNESITVQNSPGFGNKAWGSDGTTYHLKAIEVRVYQGEHTTEPAAEPVDQFSQTYGNRTGQGEAMECLGVFYVPTDDVTVFEYVTVTARDS